MRTTLNGLLQGLALLGKDNVPTKELLIARLKADVEEDIDESELRYMDDIIKAVVMAVIETCDATNPMTPQDVAKTINVIFAQTKAVE